MDCTDFYIHVMKNDQLLDDTNLENERLLKSFENELNKKITAEVFDQNHKNTFCYFGPWYEWKEDLTFMSIIFPSIEIEVYGEGEDIDDRWIALFKNGKRCIRYYQITKPIVTLEMLENNYQEDPIQFPILSIDKTKVKNIIQNNKIDLPTDFVLLEDEVNKIANIVMCKFLENNMFQEDFQKMLFEAAKNVLADKLNAEITEKAN